MILEVRPAFPDELDRRIGYVIRVADMSVGSCAKYLYGRFDHSFEAWMYARVVEDRFNRRFCKEEK